MMMGEVSLEPSPKNIMIQDMINSKTVYYVHVTAHVTAHITANFLYFTIDFYMLPHVTAFFIKIYYIYIFIKRAVTCGNM